MQFSIERRSYSWTLIECKSKHTLHVMDIHELVNLGHLELIAVVRRWLESRRWCCCNFLLILIENRPIDLGLSYSITTALQRSQFLCWIFLLLLCKYSEYIICTSFLCDSLIFFAFALSIIIFFCINCWRDLSAITTAKLQLLFRSRTDNNFKDFYFFYQLSFPSFIFPSRFPVFSYMVDCEKKTCWGKKRRRETYDREQ